LPAFFDRNDSEVKGISATRGTDLGKGKKVDSFFSRFMLERLKKSSILNHDCFKKEDVDYKATVTANFNKY